MSQMIPPDLAAALAQQGPPGLPGPSGPVPGGLASGAPPDQEPQPAPDGGLGALQDVIEDFPALLAALHDPGDVNAAAQCLAKLTAIQARLMSAQQSGPQGY